MYELDDFEMQKELEIINNMTHVEICRAWRHYSLGHRYFVVPVLQTAFKKRFNSFGGFTPEISKAIGW